MLHSEAVIGKPSTQLGAVNGTVAEYALTGYNPSPNVIKPLPEPTVFQTSLTQARGLTIMNFTRKFDPSVPGALVREHNCVRPRCFNCPRRGASAF